MIYSAGVHGGVGETLLVFQPGVDILKSPCAPALKAPRRCQFSILKPDPLFNNASLSTSGGRREEIYHPVQPGLGGERGGNGDDELYRATEAREGWGGGGGGMSTKPLTTRRRHLRICIEPLETGNQGKGKDNAHYEELTRHFLHFLADWSSTYFFNQQFFSPRQL